MRIRDLLPADLDMAWRINQANTPAVGDEPREAMDAILAMCNIALAVDVADELAGFCMVLPPGTAYESPNYRYFCDRYDDFVYLDRVAFDSHHQGFGYGAALYREVERRTTAPLFTLEVNVKPPNEGSIRFHRREGFIEVDQQETRPGKIVSLMVKHLLSDTNRPLASTSRGI
ncbi:MAG: GNAT family N-acetyltransferase [Actinomycetota bacterium]